MRFGQLDLLDAYETRQFFDRPIIFFKAQFKHFLEVLLKFS